MFFRKQKKYEMNKDIANRALQDVFTACDKAPNTTPFDKLVLREKANTRPYNRMLLLTAMLLALTFLTPLLIVPLTAQISRWRTPEPPELVNDYVEDSCLYLQFTGDNIQYEDAYLEKQDGTILPILSYDAKSKTICFPYIEDSESNIYIPIKGGGALHLLLTPR